MSPASTQRRKRGLNPVPKENVSFTAPLDQAPPAGFVSVTRVIPVWGGGGQKMGKEITFPQVCEKGKPGGDGWTRQRPCSRTSGMQTP